MTEGNPGQQTQAASPNEKTEPTSKSGELIVVGCGIKGLAQMTLEAKGWIEQADVVYFLVAEPLTNIWLRKTRPDAINLHSCYAGDKPRVDSYEEMCSLMLNSVKENKVVCAVFYGHPGVFSYPPHLAISRARAQGYRAQMLAGVSAEDCLYADLGIDPASYSCQQFEATELLARERLPSKDAHVIIWQIGQVCDSGFDPAGKFTNGRIDILEKHLREVYGPDYDCYLYLGTTIPGTRSSLKKLKISELSAQTLHPVATLYIPPTNRPAAQEIVAKLGLNKKPKAYMNKELPTPNLDSGLYSPLYEFAVHPRAQIESEEDLNAFLSRLNVQLEPDEIEALRSRNVDWLYGRLYPKGSF